MRIKTILVPTDFSELSNEAVDYAFSMAKRTGAKMVFMHTLEWLDHPDEMTPMADGAPFVEIIRAARNNNADLIIMGTHGRTGLSHIMMGSQVEKVVRQAPCPVLTVKSPQHVFTPA